MVNAKRRRRTKTLFLYSVYAEYPQHKVAIDSTSQTVKNNMNTHDLAGKRSHDPPLETGVYGYDVEKTEEHNGRKMSRVGGGVLGDSDSGSMMSVGKQMELESSNAIKYRTCSWQKVNIRIIWESRKNSATPEIYSAFPLFFRKNIWREIADQEKR